MEWVAVAKWYGVPLWELLSKSVAWFERGKFWMSVEDAMKRITVNEQKL